VFAQQSLQPKLSCRRYASVSYALQNNTVFRRAQRWVSVSDGSRTDNGSEFQSVGPETAVCLNLVICVFRAVYIFSYRLTFLFISTYITSQFITVRFWYLIFNDCFSYE